MIHTFIEKLRIVAVFQKCPLGENPGQLMKKYIAESKDTSSNKNTPGNP